MRIKLRIDSETFSHVCFTVFEDGALTGRLTFTKDGFREFAKLVRAGVVNSEIVYAVSYKGARNYY